MVTFVVAVGHAAAGENQISSLSRVRAERILRELEYKGVAAKERYSDGKGSTQPVADNASPQGRARNRRVEIEVGYAYDGKRHEPQCK